MKKLFKKLFGTDSEWPMVLTATGFSAALFSLVYIFYPNEYAHTIKLWYVLGATIVLPILGLYFGYQSVKKMNDPNADKNRIYLILVAVAFALLTCIPSAQYRADKSDNIEFDKIAE